MKVKEKGNYKFPNWTLDVMCTGKGGWVQKHKPCYGTLTLEDGDIVKRGYDDEFDYGCICPECGCFTVIPKKDIPIEVQTYAPRVATKGSDQYDELTDEEKKLSELL